MKTISHHYFHANDNMIVKLDEVSSGKDKDNIK